jgi:hypothetical protein
MRYLGKSHHIKLLEIITETEMKGFTAVFKREFKSYFATPLAYVFLMVFLFFSGYLTFKEGFFEARQADMTAFFVNIPLLFVFLVPAAAMRLWAEEKKNGSIELLFTLPITVTQAVLGKFLAAAVPYRCDSADVSDGDNGLLSWQAGYWIDGGGVSGDDSYGGWISGGRVLFLGSQQ